MISVENRCAIDALIAAYAFGYDELDWDLYRSVWTNDASLGAGKFTLAGPDSIVDWARKRRESLRDDGIQTRHYQTNVLLNQASDRTMQGRVLLQVAHQHRGAPGPEIAHTGVYQDEYRRIDGAWLIHSRRIVIDHD